MGCPVMGIKEPVADDTLSCWIRMLHMERSKPELKAPTQPLHFHILLKGHLTNSSCGSRNKREELFPLDKLAPLRLTSHSSYSYIRALLTFRAGLFSVLGLSWAL